MGKKKLIKQDIPDNNLVEEKQKKINPDSPKNRSSQKTSQTLTQNLLTPKKESEEIEISDIKSFIDGLQSLSRHKEDVFYFVKQMAADAGMNSKKIRYSVQTKMMHDPEISKDGKIALISATEHYSLDEDDFMHGCNPGGLVVVIKHKGHLMMADPAPHNDFFTTSNPFEKNQPSVADVALKDDGTISYKQWG